MIERSIIIGLITSTAFLQQIRPIWETKFLKSVSAQQLSQWCVEYFDEYHKAPEKTIESIYYEKLRTGYIKKDLAEDMESTIADLSDEYEESFNLPYILKKVSGYIKERHLELHLQEVKDLSEAGEILEAQALASSYKGVSFEISNDLDLSSPNVLLKIENAFKELSQPLITYPGALGAFWNHQLIPGGFIGLMAREKLGKTFWLLDMAIRATRQGTNVAFFQAGDMTENQQLKRICSWLTKKPTLERNCGEVYIPVVDCVRNQLDLCDKQERECNHSSPFVDEEFDEKSIRKEINISLLKQAYEDEPDYKPCRNCMEFHTKALGTPWLRKVNVKHTVKINEAKKKVTEFFIERKRRFHLSTHANGTLSVEGMEAIMDRWEREDGFVPQIILVDYADILITNKIKEFRHQQNQIWKDLRGMSQSRNALVVAPTQSDSQSYEQDTLKLKNFSEDKRKYAHCTAMYGMNQDKSGREKKIGLMRLNEIVVREGDFDINASVTILQQLNLGRPFLGSYL